MPSNNPQTPEKSGQKDQDRNKQNPQKPADDSQKKDRENKDR